MEEFKKLLQLAGVTASRSDGAIPGDLDRVLDSKFDALQGFEQAQP